jgi:hypothetical protein
MLCEVWALLPSESKPEFVYLTERESEKWTLSTLRKRLPKKWSKTKFAVRSTDPMDCGKLRVIASAKEEEELTLQRVAFAAENTELGLFMFVYLQDDSREGKEPQRAVECSAQATAKVSSTSGIDSSCTAPSATRVVCAPDGNFTFSCTAVFNFNVPAGPVTVTNYIDLSSDQEPPSRLAYPQPLSPQKLLVSVKTVVHQESLAPPSTTCQRWPSAARLLFPLRTIDESVLCGRQVAEFSKANTGLEEFAEFMLIKHPDGNIFSDPSDPNQLHPDAACFLNGLVNAYCEAPAKGKNSHLREAQPDADSNPLFVQYFNEFMAFRSDSHPPSDDSDLDDVAEKPSKRPRLTKGRAAR